jgi:hypothetical protein
MGASDFHVGPRRIFHGLKRHRKPTPRRDTALGRRPIHRLPGLSAFPRTSERGAQTGIAAYPRASPVHGWPNHGFWPEV